jgi:hypothetical protein
LILKNLNLFNATADAQIFGFSATQQETFDSIETFDRVIFMGDLNYRVDLGSSGTPEEFKKVELLSRNCRWTELVPGDQLLSEMNKEKVFFSYQEALPLGSFPPTYRMNKNQQGYSNKKDQNPSFTDRILYRGQMSCSAYTANHELLVRPDWILTISDHRPVLAALEWKIESNDWGENVTFRGVNHHDILLKINHISFKSIATSMMERSVLFTGDENSRFLDTENSNEGRSTSLLKRKVSFSNPRYMLRRNSSSGQTIHVSEDFDDQQLLEDEFANLNIVPDEQVDFKISASWSIDYPLSSELHGSIGIIRSFASLRKMLDTPLRIGVFTHFRNLVGYARIFLPKDIGFDHEVVLECPVGNRGARVGDLTLRLQLDWE